MGLRALLTDRARASRLTYLILAALIVWYAGWIAYISATDKPTDFYVYYLAAFGFERGDDVYSLHDYPGVRQDWAEIAGAAGVENFTYPYRYPPLTAQLAWPLTLLGPRPAALVWLIATAAAFVASALLLAALTDEPWARPVALGLLFFFVPALTTLRAGQVNGLLLLALCAGLLLLMKQRPVGAGFAIAVASLLKLVPVALLGYLFWRRQWRAGIAAVLSVAVLLLSAIPLTGLGGLASYARNFLGLGEAGQLVPSAPNQSFNGFFARLLVPVPGQQALADAPELAMTLYLAASVLLVLATMALCWPRGDFRRFGELEYALIVAAISLLTPYVWYYQLVLLLIPFFILIKQALTVDGLRFMLAPLAVGYAATCAHGLFWQRIAFSPVLSSMPFFTTLMLWAFLAYLLYRGKWGRGFDGMGREPYHQPSQP
jgi:hypothetical protein